jgi:hypothetical protein
MIFSQAAGPPPGLNARAITGPVTVTAASFDALTVNASAGAVTVNPPANTMGAVWWVTKSDSSASTVTLAATIDGVANPTLVFQGQIAEIVGDGTIWQRVVRPGLFQLPDLSAFPAGVTGAAGAAGAKWWVGTGAPGTVTGAITGDYYINETTGEVWKSTSGASTGNSAIAQGRALISGGSRALVIPGIQPLGSPGIFTESPGRARYSPFIVTTSITVGAIVMELTTGVAASTMRVAIYNADINWQPTTLVANTDTGNIATAVANQGVISTSITSTVLPPGRYLFWSNLSTGNTATRCVVGNVTPLLGTVATLGATSLYGQTYIAQAYGAPPSTGLAWTGVATSGIAAGFSWSTFLDVTAP